MVQCVPPRHRSSNLLYYSIGYALVTSYRALVLLSAPSVADTATVRTDTGLVQGVLDDDVIVYKEPLAGKCGHGHESTPRPRTADILLLFSSKYKVGKSQWPGIAKLARVQPKDRASDVHRTDIRSRHDAGFARAFSDGHLHEREEGSVIAPPKTIAGSRAVPHWEQIFRT